MSKKPNILSVADEEALSALPRGKWFIAMHLPIKRPLYRCERLEQKGKLISRVTGEYPALIREYKRVEVQP